MQQVSINGEVSPRAVESLSPTKHEPIHPALPTRRELQRATIGGGSHLGDVGLALNAQGRALATGVCPFVGIGGHGGYGGFGFFSRSWGLVVDQLRSVEIVTADGQIRNVSATSADSDLFWVRTPLALGCGHGARLTLLTCSRVCRRSGVLPVPTASLPNSRSIRMQRLRASSTLHMPTTICHRARSYP